MFSCRIRSGSNIRLYVRMEDVLYIGEIQLGSSVRNQRTVGLFQEDNPGCRVPRSSFHIFASLYSSR